MNERTRRRWFVDAMNVVGSRPDKWWNDPDRALRDLTARLDAFAEATGDELTVVFDKAPAGLEPPAHARTVVARWKGRNAADHEIEELVSGDADPASITVVTSDRRLAERVRETGARVEGAGRFRSRVDQIAKKTP